MRFAPGRLRLATRPNADRITSGGKNDGYGRGRWLRRHRRRRAGGYEYRYAAADEIGCERRQQINLIFRPAEFDRHVVPLDIAGFLQALEKRKGEVLVFVVGGLGAEIPDYRHRRLLRPRHHRPRRRAPESRDELPPPHP